MYCTVPTVPRTDCQSRTYCAYGLYVGTYTLLSCTFLGNFCLAQGKAFDSAKKGKGCLIKSGGMDGQGWLAEIAEIYCTEVLCTLVSSALLMHRGVQSTLWGKSLGCGEVSFAAGRVPWLQPH